MSQLLDISPDLALPLDAVTQKFAWLGRSGGGKTYGLKRFVEQMLGIGVQVVVLDSVGVWSGLRLGPDAFDVPIIGGLYGDIPLEPTSGALVAEVATSHGSSMVLDTSQMLDAQRARFCEAFGRRLFELKKIAPGAMHVVLDEGQDVVPQNPNEGEKMMLHEWVRIAKQGRAFGIGLSIASQRPQEVNKKALNQAECVVAFQLTGSHERKALEYWLADKGMEAKLSDTLTTLDIGRPFVWSPQWLKISRIIERILPIKSADTSKTPQFGDAPVVARAMRPIDLGALRASMAAATDEAKTNDPKALRARIKELELLVAAGAGPQATPIVVFDKKRAEQLRDSYDKYFARAEQLLQWEHSELREIVERMEKLHRNARQLEQHLEASTLSEDLGAFLEDLRATAVPKAPAAAPKTAPAKTQAAAVPKAHAVPVVDGLPPGEAAVLDAISQKKGGATKPYLVLVTGLAAGSVRSYTQRLVSKGLVSRGNGVFLATAEAFKLLPERAPLPSGKALVKHYIDTLPGGENKVFETIARGARGSSWSRSLLAEATGLAEGSVRSYTQRLVTRGLVERSDDGMRLHSEFGL